MHHLEKQMHEADKLSRAKEKGDKKALKARLQNQSKRFDTKLNSLGLLEMHRDILSTLDTCYTIADLLAVDSQELRTAYNAYYTKRHLEINEDFDWKKDWKRFVKQLNKICAPHITKGVKQFDANVLFTATVDKADKPLKYAPPRFQSTNDVGVLDLSLLAEEVVDMFDNVLTIRDLVKATAQEHRVAFTEYWDSVKDSPEYKDKAAGKLWKKYMDEINKVLKPYREGGKLEVLDWSWEIAQKILNDIDEDDEDEDFDDDNFNMEDGVIDAAADQLVEHNDLTLDTPIRNTKLQRLSQIILITHFANRPATDTEKQMTIRDLTKWDSPDLYMAYHEYQDNEVPDHALNMTYRQFINDINRTYRHMTNPFSTISDKVMGDVWRREAAEKKTQPSFGLDDIVEDCVKFDYDDTHKILHHYWRHVEENEDGMTVGDLINLNADDLYDAFQNYDQESDGTEMLLTEFYDDLNKHVASLRENGPWINPVKQKVSKTKMQSPTDAEIRFADTKNAMRHLSIIDKSIKTLEAEQSKMLRPVIAALISQRDRLCETDTIYRDAQVLINSYNMIPE